MKGRSLQGDSPNARAHGEAGGRRGLVTGNCPAGWTPSASAARSRLANSPSLTAEEAGRWQTGEKGPGACKPPHDTRVLNFLCTPSAQHWTPEVFLLNYGRSVRGPDAQML